MAETIESKIKSPKAEVFRRAAVKRRSIVTGLFEDDWVDVSSDVKSWGKVTSNVDSVRLHRFTFGNVRMVFQNEEGKYNPEDSESSLWYGYLNQQRTLVKLEAGFVTRYKGPNGAWISEESPCSDGWDEALWDGETSIWDADVDASVVFTGIVSGDILLSEKNEASLNLKPLTSVFQDYPAKNLTGWTSTGMTASDFIGMLRDQTDGSGGFVFRPFFGNTTTNWDISTTSIVYGNLHSSTADGVRANTVWDIIEKLAEAENYVPYVTREGKFRFVSLSANTTTVAFEFYGAGINSSTYGNTIKQINSMGRKLSKYYSRVEVKWQSEDTSTSYEIAEASFEVSPASNPWILGHRTLKIENLYIPNTATAANIALTVFTDYSSLKREIDFTTSFVPHLDLLDRFSIYYDPIQPSQNSIWDQFNWAETNTDTSSDLIWDSSKGQSIYFYGEEFKFLSFEIDLDNLQNKFIAREV